MNLIDWTTLGVVEMLVSTTAGVETIEARWTTGGSGYMRIEFFLP
jgi:hypothetical protein